MVSTSKTIILPPIHIIHYSFSSLYTIPPSHCLYYLRCNPQKLKKKQMVYLCTNFTNYNIVFRILGKCTLINSIRINVKQAKIENNFFINLHIYIYICQPFQFRHFSYVLPEQYKINICYGIQ